MKPSYLKAQLAKLEAFNPTNTAKGVRLYFNENFLGQSPRIKEALQAADNFNYYGDGWGNEVKAALAIHHQLKAENFLIGAGADELIKIVSEAALAPGDNIIVAKPTFPQYAHSAVLSGAEVIEVPLTVDGVHDLNAMAKSVTSRTKLIWLCNPHNPTGTYVNDQAFNAFMKQVPEGVLVVADEAYVEYVRAADFPATLELINQHSNLIALRTFSKIHGIASLRIGYAIGDEHLIAELEKVRLPFNVSSVSQLAAIAALSDGDFVRQSHEINAQGVAQYEAALTEAGIDFYLPQGNFVYVLSPQNNGQLIGKKLLEAGYLVKADPEGLRITIGRDVHNEDVIAVLKENAGLL